VALVGQVLTGKGTATFFQLDRRNSMMMDAQLALQIPLVQGKKKQQTNGNRRPLWQSV
jgi:hypothetical protein